MMAHNNGSAFCNLTLRSEGKKYNDLFMSMGYILKSSVFLRKLVIVRPLNFFYYNVVSKTRTVTVILFNYTPSLI